MLAQLFEKSIILKYSAEPKGATAYLKMLYFPYTYTIIRASMWGLGLYLLLALTFLLLLSGCASYDPKFKLVEKQPVSLQMVQNDPVLNTGKNIIWGGRVVSIINKQDSTHLEVIAYPLNYTQRPVERASPGRFIAIKQGYLESVDYIDKFLTIQGKVKGLEKNIVGSEIDAAGYQFPVIEIQQVHVWSVVQAPRVHFNFGFVFRN